MVVKETEYKGILFRSRLEARVAVFFDKAGIEWVYEPDRVVNGDSEYNPDFYLPELDDYVEVKGKRPGYEKEILKAREHLTWGGDIKRLVIISEIPDPTAPGLPHFPCYYWGEYGVTEGLYYFFDRHEKVYGKITTKQYLIRPNINPDLLRPGIVPGAFNISPMTDYEMEYEMEAISAHFESVLERRKARLLEKAELTRKQNPITFKAYAAARKADFTMRRAG